MCLSIRCTYLTPNGFTHYFWVNYTVSIKKKFYDLNALPTALGSMNRPWIPNYHIEFTDKKKNNIFLSTLFIFFWKKNLSHRIF